MSTRKERTAKERRMRQPLGVARKKMSLDKRTEDLFKREGLVPRWVNDEDHGGRVQSAVNGGYDFVSSDGEMIIGDSIKKEDANRRVRKLVGSHKDGSPKYAYLMAIKKEFYDEDQSVKEERNQMVDDAIRGGEPGGLKPHGVTPDMGSTNVKNVQYTP
jgi:hypothetical protein